MIQREFALANGSGRRTIRIAVQISENELYANI